MKYDEHMDRQTTQNCTETHPLQERSPDLRTAQDASKANVANRMKEDVSSHHMLAGVAG